MSYLDDLFNKITTNYTEQDVFEKVDEMKSEFVWDWEDEFETLEEAYSEQGRGEAEQHVLQDMIKKEDSNLSTDDFCRLQQELADHYGLDLD